MKERIFIQKARAHVQLEEWLLGQFADSRCGGIEITYTPLGERIVVYTASPGLVIGQGGEKVREVTEKLKEQFKLQNPQIDVQKITKADLSPQIVAENITSAIERNVNFKRLGNYYVERIMKAGAIGCEIKMSGKLSGEKARTERFTAGYLKKAGETALHDVAKGRAIANPPLGNIGITVSIMLRHSDKMPEIKKEQVSL